MNTEMLAGACSTALFVGSYLPMLVKAARTRDMDSYSRGQLVLATVGNVLNSLYVFSLPVGPIWFLHLFNLVCTLFMLVWHLRFAAPRRGSDADGVTSHPGPGREVTARLPQPSGCADRAIGHHRGTAVQTASTLVV